ncbi:MAG: hypothetical protein JOZ38_08010 [Candidatus Eremiobacteraeota bacterium]|nr:hypothetical protein [Candidatus Eremiobacteraeota bacterium]
MPTPDEPTTAFSLMPFLMRIEGTSTRLGLFVGMLYEDKGLPRDAWCVDHRQASRKDVAVNLKPQGSTVDHLGVGAKDALTAALIKRRAESLGLTCQTVSLDDIDG